VSVSEGGHGHGDGHEEDHGHDHQDGHGLALLEKLSGWVLRHGRAVMLGFVVLVGLAFWRASRLHLKTDLVELLPQNAPAVATLRHMDQRLESVASIVVVVQSPEREANRRFVDALVPALRALPGGDIATVQWGVNEEHQFYEHNGPLYASLEDLNDAADRLQREILRRKNPAFIDLSDEKESVSDLIDEETNKLLSRFPDDHFANEDGTVYAVVVRLRGSLLTHAHGADTVAAVSRAVQATSPRRFHPQMTVGLTGNVLSALKERQALEDDLKLATGLCVVFVGLAMFIFFRALTPLLSSIVPSLAGVGCSMALAQMAFGYLNSSTAFLVSIVLGNGINYAIIQTARYEEERRQGRAPAEAARLAVATTWRATGIAAWGAAVSYGALALTSFRGFNQFGAIGGAGMVLSWLATLIILPPMWVRWDRRRSFSARGHAFAGPIGWLARQVARAPLSVLLGSLVLSIVSLVALPRYARDPFEYDYRKLGNHSRARSQVEQLSSKLDPIFGRSLSPGFILCDDPSQAPAIKRALRARDPDSAVIAKISIIDDLLPGDGTLQQAKLNVLDKIRRLIDKNLALLTAEEKQKVLRHRPADDLRVLRPADLPLSMRFYFTERDGTIGRPVLYFPPNSVSVWDGRYLIRLASVVEDLRLDNGQVVRSSGSGVVFAEMLRSIVHDGPRVTAVAFFGVIVTVVALVGLRRETWLTLATLWLGVLWMIGGAALAHVRINFLNFIALPITFGIGVDYGINLMERHRLEKSDGGLRVLRTVAGTGGAVALCSLTTIIGYAALLVAENHALRSFGAMAIAGELACSAAALTVLPALLLTRRQPVENHRRG
jgi:uncharacterized protein